MNTKHIVAIVCGSMLLGAMPAFAQGEAPAEPAPSAQAPAAQEGPTDPQIAEIVVVANQVDVDAAKLALKHSKNKEVKSFAKTMIRDHDSVNKQAKALVKKLKVKPEPSATSKSLSDGGKENLAALKKLKGAAFDSAYVDHEVAYHEQVIDALNKTLIPSAKNAQLKALMVKVLPVFDAHLAHAKELQAKLSGAATK